jgi:hypothetical protein
MKPMLDKTPRSERTLEYYFDDIMNTVVKVFLLCVPKHDQESFISEVYEPLKALRVSGDEVVRNFNQAGGTQLGKADMSLLACIYAIESRWAGREGKDEQAWALLMEAQHYISMSVAADVSEPQLAWVLDMARTEAKHKAAQDSAAVATQAWRETRQEAFRLIEERVQDGRSWDSAEQAATEILDELKTFLQTRPSRKRRNFLTTTPEKTVADWLRQMPNAGSLFNDQTMSN